jgi:release factor glutamine methyltransferase
MTIREALSEGTASLAAMGVDTPSLDSSLLLAEVLNTSRSKLTAAAHDNISSALVATFRQLIKRRQAGECIAYILGRKEFYCLEFLVNTSVLVPRPDTEMLVDVALKIIVNAAESKVVVKHPPRALDLCTGSGAIAIVLKHLITGLEVWATDISAEALETAKTNASRLLPPNSIRFFRGDLYDALPSSPPLPTRQLCWRAHCSLLTIVSNPPYIPSAEISSLSPEVRMEPTLALDGGDDGLGVIRKIVSRAPEFLCKGGSLLLEADPRQMAAIADLYKKAGFSDIQTHTDLSGKERVISGII